MEHLLRRRKRLMARMSKRQPILILTDYDGTLTRIAKTPDQAKLSRATRSALVDLSRVPGMHIGIVSGRSLGEIKRLVGIPRLIYAGNHGLELAGPGFAFVHPRARATQPLLRRLARRLAETIRHIPGAFVEWKGLTISLHWRMTLRALHRRFRDLVNAATISYRREKQIRLTYGKRVVEIRPPVDWDKGAMIEWVFNRLAAQHRPKRLWLMYLGDDQTDEDAFRTVNRLRGISVFVGRPGRHTRAKWWLRGPREVRRWLVELCRLRRTVMLQEGGRS